jgi:hypothetical protein
MRALFALALAFAAPLALATSRSVLAKHLAGAVQGHLFDIWPALDLCIRYGAQLDAETHANIKQVVTTFTQYKDTNTANLQTLAWTVRYLVASFTARPPSPVSGSPTTGAPTTPTPAPSCGPSSPAAPPPATPRSPRAPIFGKTCCRS